MQTNALKSGSCLRKLLLALVYAFATALVASCGGGGAGESISPPPSPSPLLPALSGQVIKGLVTNSNVTLYALNEDGLKTALTSVTTGATGSFSLPNSIRLKPGSVYLLEGIGGQYINEFTGLSEPLTTPIRAVFVAGAGDMQFALSAISELVAIEIEQNAPAPKWSAANVAIASQEIQQALDLASLHDVRYFDLSRLNALQASDLSEEEFQISFQIGLFAGFYQQLRNAGQTPTLSTAFRALHDLYLNNNQPGNTASFYLTAGLIQYVDSVPLLKEVKSEIYRAWGLPSDFSQAAFDGIEFSGSASEAVPNSKLRLFLAYDTPTDTIFNSRGALIGYPSGLGGYAYASNTGIADVYGNNEVAIGRWNRGYAYLSGASYDRQENTFTRLDQPPTLLTEDIVYVAGVPATNMPQCSRKTLRLAAQTKPFFSRDSGVSLTLGNDSRINLLSLGTAVYVGYNLTLTSMQGATYSFVSSESGSAPEQGIELNPDRTFASARLPRLPGGEFLQFRGLLAGEGGRRAVLNISGYSLSTQMAAAFEQEGSDQPCSTPTFSTGSINPKPVAGNFFFNESSLVNSQDIVSLNFFSNGAPNPNGIRAFQGVAESHTREIQGNNLVGIGIYAPPILASGLPVYTPIPFAYRKVPDANAQVLRTGVLNYRLVASTPYLLTDPRQVIAADRRIVSAELKIHVSRPPLGDDIPGRGFCLLTINGGSPISGGYSQDTGGCYIGGILQAALPNQAAYNGGIGIEDRRFAVILATEHLGYNFSSQIKGQYAMLFELVP